MKRNKIIAIAVPAAILAVGAAWFAARKMQPTIPEGVDAVKGFDAGKYLGKWYEIARLDFKWEKGLSNVTATYSMNDDGTIHVDNRGVDPLRDEWKNSIGKAKFVKTPDVGMLKVSFFGPFYAGYNVIAIDENYRYALVFGRNLDYMWLLSREKTMPESVARTYLHKAAEAGYDISRLQWTDQQ